MNIDDVLGQLTPARRTVAICIRGDLAGRLEELQERWRAAVSYDAEHNEPSTATRIWDEIAALEHEAEAAIVSFTVESIGGSAWRRLVAEHPPVDDLEGWRWNLDTFPPAATAASCIEPAMTENEAAELADRLSNGQWSKLFGAVLAVNVGDDLMGKFVGAIGSHRGSEPSLTTAPSEESPTPSS